MGTVIEGEWDEIMKLIKKCHKTVMKTGERSADNNIDRRQERETEQDRGESKINRKKDWEISKKIGATTMDKLMKKLEDRCYA